jgi:ATP-dependent DNA helicase MPH1
VSKSKLPTIYNDVTEEDEEDVEHDDLLELPNPPRQRPAAKKSAMAINKKRGRPSKKQQTGVYDESADEGDDCLQTSDLELTDESDNGSDLVDFVVGDDMATSSALFMSSTRRLSTSPTTPPMSSTAGCPSGRGRLYAERKAFGTIEDSDDDMPSMSQLVSRQKTQALETSDREETDDDEIVQRAVRGPRRRAVIDDDDDDSDA